MIVMPAILSKLPVMISDDDIIDKRYENCIIYKLVHKDDEDAYEKYVGHTINGLKERMWYHRRGCNNENLRSYNYKVYQYIRETGDIDMWDIIKIIDYPCKNKNEASKKEGGYIKSLNCSLNTVIAGRSIKEYYHDNIEEMRKKDRARWKDRKEKQSKYSKERIICNNCGCDCRKSDIARHKKTAKCQSHIK
jgi:hypothetical protein